jgi:hypothetical protein
MHYEFLEDNLTELLSSSSCYWRELASQRSTVQAVLVQFPNKEKRIQGVFVLSVSSPAENKRR